MSQSCSECGVTTRGGACSLIDSRRQRNIEIARCPNARHYAPHAVEYAREAVKRDLGWES